MRRILPAVFFFLLYFVIASAAVPIATAADESGFFQSILNFIKSGKADELLKFDNSVWPVDANIGNKPTVAPTSGQEQVQAHAGTPAPSQSQNPSYDTSDVAALHKYWAASTVPAHEQAKPDNFWSFVKDMFQGLNPQHELEETSRDLLSATLPREVDIDKQLSSGLPPESGPKLLAQGSGGDGQVLGVSDEGNTEIANAWDVIQKSQLPLLSTPTPATAVPANATCPANSRCSNPKGCGGLCDISQNNGCYCGGCRDWEYCENGTCYWQQVPGYDANRACEKTNNPAVPTKAPTCLAGSQCKYQEGCGGLCNINQNNGCYCGGCRDWEYCVNGTCMWQGIAGYDPNKACNKQTASAYPTPISNNPNNPDIPNNPNNPATPNNPSGSIPQVTPASGVLDYDLPFYKTDSAATAEIDRIYRILPTNMNSGGLLNALKSRRPTSMIDYWQMVLDTAYNKGWNPALILTLWIEETGASDACKLNTGIWDIGVVSLPKTTCNDPQKYPKLVNQLNAVLNMINYLDPPKTFAHFMCKYADGKWPCDVANSPNKLFFPRVKQVYNCLLNPYKSNPDCSSYYFNTNLFVNTSPAANPPGNQPTGVPANPPNAPVGENVAFAMRIVDGIRANPGCAYSGRNGVVWKGNYSACLNNASPAIPEIGKKEFIDSVRNATAEGFLQCVGFVRGIKSIAINNTFNKTGNGIDWQYGTYPAGYRFVKKGTGTAVKPGDIAVYDFTYFGNAYGHVAYVIDAGESQYRTLEANFNSDGEVSRSPVRLLSSPYLVGWITR